MLIRSWSVDLIRHICHTYDQINLLITVGTIFPALDQSSPQNLIGNSAQAHWIAR